MFEKIEKIFEKKQKMALVLGGGSARGIAHVGVIKYLEEIHQKPDLIIGTSMGALVGAFYAIGHTSEEMQKIPEEVAVFGLVDPDFSEGGIKGNKVVRFLEKYFGDKTFADCVIPLKIIATNLDTGEKIVFTKGKLVDAVRASISIPGAFVPFKYEWMTLVDGGIVANLAVEEAPKNYKILAISVQIPIGEKIKKQRKKSIFNFQNPFLKGYLVLRKSVGIMIIANETASLKERPDTYLLRLPNPEIDYYDFDKASMLIEKWYELIKHSDWHEKNMV